jgi:hypothetical protein
MAGYPSTVPMVIGPAVRTRCITPASAQSPSWRPMQSASTSGAAKIRASVKTEFQRLRGPDQDHQVPIPLRFV